MTEDTCQWAKCRQPSSLIYFGIGLCTAHWVKACEESQGRNVETRKLVYHHVGQRAQKTMRETYGRRVSK